MQLQLNLIGRWMLKVFLLGLAVIAAATPVQADRIKDLASVAGVRTNQLVGYGVVVGLADVFICVFVSVQWSKKPFAEAHKIMKTRS